MTWFPWAPLPACIISFIGVSIAFYHCFIRGTWNAHRTRRLLAEKARSKLTEIRMRLTGSEKALDFPKLWVKMERLEKRLKEIATDRMNLVDQPEWYRKNYEDILKLEDELDVAPGIPPHDSPSENLSETLIDSSPEQITVQLDVNGNSAKTPSSEHGTCTQNRLFIELYNAINLHIQSSAPDSASFNIDTLENMEPLKYAEWLSRYNSPFTHCMAESTVQSKLSLLSLRCWTIERPRPKVRRLVVQSSHCESFILLIDDFFLVYDETDNTGNGAMLMRSPGSPCMSFNYQELVSHKGFFHALLGVQLPMVLLQFIVRRFVQTTNASWEFSCFADCEKKLPRATALRWNPRKSFDKVTIKLSAMTFDNISGVEEFGYLKIKDETMLDVGVRLFGEVIGFKIQGDIEQQDQIASPVHLPEVSLLADTINVDRFGFVVGGDNHQTRVSLSSMSSSRRRTSHSEPLRSQNPYPASSGTQSTGLRILKVWPSMLAIGSVNGEDGIDRPMFNLAYVPKNRLFQRLSKKSYALSNLRELKQDFLRLGYGEELSECIEQLTINGVKWSNGRTVTLFEAQRRLFQQLRRVKNSNMVAVTLGKKKYIPRNTNFLMLHENKLCLAQCKSPISKHSMFVSVSSQSDISFSPISSVRECVKQISGINPGRDNVECLLGIITFICCFLEGRVHPTGRYGVFRMETERNVCQEVEFDLPVPSGVACSTILRETLNKPIYFLIEDGWTLDRNYTRPVIPGVQHDDEHLIEALNKGSNILSVKPSEPVTQVDPCDARIPVALNNVPPPRQGRVNRTKSRRGRNKSVPQSTSTLSTPPVVPPLPASRAAGSEGASAKKQKPRKIK